MVFKERSPVVARQPLYDNYPNIAKEVRTHHKRATFKSRRHQNEKSRQILMTSHVTTCLFGVALASERT